MDVQDIQDCWLMVWAAGSGTGGVTPLSSPPPFLQQGFREPAPKLMDPFKGAPDHRASPLPVQQLLVLFILSILSIHVP